MYTSFQMDIGNGPEGTDERPHILPKVKREEFGLDGTRWRDDFMPLSRKKPRKVYRQEKQAEKRELKAMSKKHGIPVKELSSGHVLRHAPYTIHTVIVRDCPEDVKKQLLDIGAQVVPNREDMVKRLENA